LYFDSKKSLEKESFKNTQEKKWMKKRKSFHGRHDGNIFGERRKNKDIFWRC